MLMKSSPRHEVNVSKSHDTCPEEEEEYLFYRMDNLARMPRIGPCTIIDILTDIFVHGILRLLLFFKKTSKAYGLILIVLKEHWC